MASPYQEKDALSNKVIVASFDNKTIDLPLEQIAPIKLVSAGIKRSSKYLQILASIKEVGIIEPPVVSTNGQDSGKFILLDGHLRLEALKDLGETEVTCLVSMDDESFTYNKHINRLSIIQEHKMILRAIERGVPEAKIAAALNIDVRSIAAKRDLLNNICDEAAE
jgi:ParB-like chromosome segregation protein Spo0J